MTLDDILIRRISLPEAIMKAIESKLVQQQVAEEYDFRLVSEVKEAKRKRIEAEGINNYNMVVNQNLTDNILQWQGVVATKELATSPNAKTILFPVEATQLIGTLGGIGQLAKDALGAEGQPTPTPPAPTRRGPFGQSQG